MEFKGTPAPWRTATMGPNGCPIVGSKTTMVAMLAHPVNEYDQAEQAKANAHLIAAAPELLALLIKLDRIGGLGLSTHREIQSAIAKALGEMK